jgi:hypothetical protein
LSVDSLTPTNKVQVLYSEEFLNTLQFNSIANHKLEFKVGVVILLLRNLN